MEAFSSIRNLWKSHAMVTSAPIHMGIVRHLLLETGAQSWWKKMSPEPSLSKTGMYKYGAGEGDLRD
jgi:hypothetical protein